MIEVQGTGEGGSFDRARARRAARSGLAGHRCDRRTPARGDRRRRLLPRAATARTGLGGGESGRRGAASCWRAAIAGKLREVERILGDDEILPLSAFPGIAFPEEGDDYASNARAKAVTVLEATGLASLATIRASRSTRSAGRSRASARRATAGPGSTIAVGSNACCASSRVIPIRCRARFVCIAACALPDGRR